MAEGLNKVMLLGNLGADPELKMTQGGQAILKLRIATTENYLDKNNARQERTEWHSVTMWGKRGEALSRFLQKGERIFVEGRLSTSSYEKEGQKHYRTEIVANNIILAGRGKGGEMSEGGGGGGYERRPSNGGGGGRSGGGGYNGGGGGGGGSRSPDPPPAADNQDFGDYPGGDDDIPF